MNENNIAYRMQTADVADVYQHLRKCKDDFIPALDQKVDLYAYSEKLTKKAVNFEAWANDELIGLVAAYLNDEKDFVGYITNVSLLKEFSGRGIANQLLMNCIAYAKARKFKRIGLEVTTASKPAIKLYQKNGFIETLVKDDKMIMNRDL